MGIRASVDDVIGVGDGPSVEIERRSRRTRKDDASELKHKVHTARKKSDPEDDLVLRQLRLSKPKPKEDSRRGLGSKSRQLSPGHPVLTEKSDHNFSRKKLQQI